MILKHLRGWTSDWLVERRQKLQLEACEYLAYLGVPFLVTEKDYDVRQIRQSFGAVRNSELVVRLLWIIHEKGDEAQRARLKEIVAPPKMQSIVRQHDPFLLRDLGLGPKRLAKVNVTKRDRPWHSDTYRPPRPFERPAKIKTPPEPPPRPIYSPPPTASLDANPTRLLEQMEPLSWVEAANRRLACRLEQLSDSARWTHCDLIISEFEMLPACCQNGLRRPRNLGK